MEHTQIKALSRAEKQARIAEITPIINLLLEAHNSGILTATLTIVWKQGSEAAACERIEFTTGKIPHHLKTFVHDYCTFLCAEKMMLLHYLDQTEALHS
jgi:hypothetical protein